MKVPLVDLKAQYEAIASEIEVAMAAVLDQTAFIGGPFVCKFEAEFAEFSGRKFCLGVGNGTRHMGRERLSRHSGFEMFDEVTPEEVAHHVREQVEILGRGSGFVFQQVHNVMADVPPKNVVAMLEAATAVPAGS